MYIRTYFDNLKNVFGLFLRDILPKYRYCIKYMNYD